jgi:hypothetical protein
VLERRAARQFFRPSAFAELSTTAKPRTVGRVGSGQFDRSLRRSQVYDLSRARAARPVSCGRVNRPPGADRPPRDQLGSTTATESKRGRPLARCGQRQLMASWALAGWRAARPLVRGAGCRGARRARSSTMHWHALSPPALSKLGARGARLAHPTGTRAFGEAPSPGPIRRREAPSAPPTRRPRHYRARATSCGVPSYSWHYFGQLVSACKPRSPRSDRRPRTYVPLTG